VADQVDNGRGYLIGLLALHEEEVGLLAVADIGHPSFVDGVGVHDDTAGLCLAEDTSETDNGDDTGVDDVTEYVARTDTRQLVHVTDKQQTHV